jgi:hypothetical protein
MQLSCLAQPRELHSFKSLTPCYFYVGSPTTRRSRGSGSRAARRSSGDRFAGTRPRGADLSLALDMASALGCPFGPVHPTSGWTHEGKLGIQTVFSPPAHRLRSRGRRSALGCGTGCARRARWRAVWRSCSVCGSGYCSWSGPGAAFAATVVGVAGVASIVHEPGRWTAWRMGNPARSGEGRHAACRCGVTARGRRVVMGLAAVR